MKDSNKKSGSGIFRSSIIRELREQLQKFRKNKNNKHYALEKEGSFSDVGSLSGSSSKSGEHLPGDIYKQYAEALMAAEGSESDAPVKSSKKRPRTSRKSRPLPKSSEEKALQRKGPARHGAPRLKEPGSDSDSRISGSSDVENVGGRSGSSESRAGFDGEEAYMFNPKRRMGSYYVGLFCSFLAERLEAGESVSNKDFKVWAKEIMDRFVSKYNAQRDVSAILDIARHEMSQKGFDPVYYDKFAAKVLRYANIDPSIQRVYSPAERDSGYSSKSPKSSGLNDSPSIPGFNGDSSNISNSRGARQYGFQSEQEEFYNALKNVYNAFGETEQRENIMSGGGISSSQAEGSGRAQKFVELKAREVLNQGLQDAKLQLNEVREKIEYFHPERGISILKRDISPLTDKEKNLERKIAFIERNGDKIAKELAIASQSDAWGVGPKQKDSGLAMVKKLQSLLDDHVKTSSVKRRQSARQR